MSRPRTSRSASHLCERCPVALAVQRATGADEVKVNKVRIWGGSRWYHTPDEARAFILRFDAGDPVEPFGFALGEPAG